MSHFLDWKCTQHVKFPIVKRNVKEMLRVLNTYLKLCHMSQAQEIYMTCEISDIRIGNAK